MGLQATAGESPATFTPVNARPQSTIPSKSCSAIDAVYMDISCLASGHINRHTTHKQAHNPFAYTNYTALVPWLLEPWTLSIWLILVSYQRIKVTCLLQDLLAAPLDHWMHDQHDNEYYKDRSNPFFGESL